MTFCSVTLVKSNLAQKDNFSYQQNMKMSMYHVAEISTEISKLQSSLQPVCEICFECSRLLCRIKFLDMVPVSNGKADTITEAICEVIATKVLPADICFRGQKGGCCCDDRKEVNMIGFKQSQVLGLMQSVSLRTPGQRCQQPDRLLAASQVCLCPGMQGCCRQSPLQENTPARPASLLQSVNYLNSTARNKFNQSIISV